MADSSNVPVVAGFFTQANALLRKNLTYEIRNFKKHVRLFIFPVIAFAAIAYLQMTADKVTSETSMTPAIPSPREVLPLLQVPSLYNRALKTDILPYDDLPNASCLNTSSCPATILVTGNSPYIGQRLAGKLVTNQSMLDSTNINVANYVLGSGTDLGGSFVSDYAVSPVSMDGLYIIQSQCSTNSSTSEVIATAVNQGGQCVEALPLWRNSTSQINEELYMGYYLGNAKRQINEIMIAYDFLNSNAKTFNVNIWYNSTMQLDERSGIPTSWVPRSINLVSNAYLQLFLGPDARMPFAFVKEMPKSKTRFAVDVSTMIDQVLYVWMILALFPVVLSSLVYEKQEKLRIIMKMHGLGDGPYWMISYVYFLFLSSIYVLCFVAFGVIFGFDIFTKNSFSVQLVFYFTYINLQISMGFLLAGIFSNVKTASVVGYLVIFSTGLLSFLFKKCIETPSLPSKWKITLVIIVLLIWMLRTWRGESFMQYCFWYCFILGALSYGKWITILELYPGFSLYRGLYEFSQYSVMGVYMGTTGVQWGSLTDADNGLREVLVIMIVEWFVGLFAAYYVDQVISAGGGVRRSPLFFLHAFKKKPTSPLRKASLKRRESKVVLNMEKPDVVEERGKVEQLLLEPNPSYTIVCDDLKKMYPGRDGNPDKYAVRGLSLALPKGECFGMLGPNGAGKTSFISMMIGLTEPSSGTAYVQGLDLRTDMKAIYTSMGVCPQHDLLWETLSGREHLLFYGRLKNLKGSALNQAVEEALERVNLLHGGVADKQAGQYSGGMKRRLSVAISLMGDPKVVYLDEPSTGLDPASRKLLWNALKRAKEDRAIILTTHSMEEAEYLCDRLGIFVDGSFQCLGSPNELKGRYGGTFVFTITTGANQETEVEKLVRNLSPNAVMTYHIPGTQKYELPKNEVKVADVFEAVEEAKKRLDIQAWGLADTTLEDVFIKVAREGQATSLS